MFKYYVVFILSLFTLLTSAYTLQGGVSYTVESARVKSFNNIDLKINMNKYKKFIEDKNYAKNIELISKRTQNYRDRYITVYSDGDYTICYKSNLKTAYHYSKNGKLRGISLTKGRGFPSRRITYDKNGIFDSVTLDVAKDEQFIFDKNKKLVAHWIGNNCYNEQGELIMTRE